MFSDNSNKSLIRKNLSSALQIAPPPPPPNRIQRPKITLDEETYASALSEIIARDFFPGLRERQLQKEYLDALESRNRKWIARATQNLIDAAPENKDQCHAKDGDDTHIKVEETPSGWSRRRAKTPGYQVVGIDRAKKKVNTNMSLTAFQETYTSEDNESYYQLTDRQNAERACKNSWVYNNNKYDSKQLVAQWGVEQKLLESGSLNDDGYMKKDRLAIKDKDDRPAQPDTWKWKPKNGLMFTPDGYVPADLSSGPPKGINYHNLRPPMTEAELALQKPRPSSPTMSAVRDALKRHIRPELCGASEAGSTMGSETPRINGYAFVESDSEDESPEIPVIKLGPGNAKPGPFHIQEKGRKEKLLDRMVVRISKKDSGRQEKIRLDATSVMIASPRIDVGNMTPAAQRLLGKIAAGTPKRKFGGGDGSSSGKGGDFAPRTPMTPRGSLIKRPARK